MTKSAKKRMPKPAVKETDSQQHSVREFLARVVRRKLRLKLLSGKRTYRISDGAKVDHEPFKDLAV
jgi:hypothetical protein